MLPKVDVLGVRVSSATVDELMKAFDSAVARKDRGRTVCAVNVHTWAEAKRSPAVASAMDGSDIAWPDGVPITWAARWAGHPIGPRIHGHDLMRTAFRKSFSHYFYGSTPEVLEEMKVRVRREFPDLRIAGSCSPAFSRGVGPIDPAHAADIRSSGADILWVALGAPKQELWMQLNRDRIDVPVMVGVGAAFEILAGRFRRAPQALQRMGLEWAWRLAQDPARLWRRYLSTNGLFLASLLARR